MVVVYFFQNKDLLLSQYLKKAPAVGDALNIKGRKGKVASVNEVEAGKVHVQLAIEKVVPKGKQVVEDPKKKKR